MNQTVRNIFLIIILMLSVLFMPALLGASVIELPEEDDLTDTDGDDFSVISNFSPAWIRIPIHQMSVLLRLGISIFALFVVYLGGRSKHRRFNDRTIDHINVLIAEFLKTALVRAVFNFRFFTMSIFLSKLDSQFNIRSKSYDEFDC
jgi:hypothetical protein